MTNEMDKTICKEYIDKTTLKRMKLVSSEPSTRHASSSKKPQTSPSFTLEKEILEEVRMVEAMLKDLTKRVEVVENKVDKIHAKTFEKQESTQEPKKAEEQEGVSKRRRKICVFKKKATTKSDDPINIEE